MIYFATVLRCLAACIITNSHYTGVYPTDLIANGGLLGDVIFFAVSGFCLVNVKGNFFQWYGKRLLRLYPAVLLITLAYLLAGLFTAPENAAGWLRLFIYPTNYHFVASILFLYIPFYFVMRIQKLRENIPLLSAGLCVVWLLVYILIYDRSYYHIDTVREPMIRFLFFFSMLLGAYFRISKDRFLNRKCVWAWVLLPCLLAGYFASKLLFVRMERLADFQLVNQIVLFALLAVLFRCFASVDGKLERLPRVLKRVIEFVASITLEIYLVQISLIPKLNIFPFPLNWLFITGTILLLAWILHKLTGWIQAGLQRLFSRRRKNAASA